MSGKRKRQSFTRLLTSAADDLGSVAPRTLIQLLLEHESTLIFQHGLALSLFAYDYVSQT
jgi:hypothetical protein